MLKDGLNLLDPGSNPKDNIQFLTFLVAVIKAVHENSDLLRISVASAGNDHRLGANEAPPAVVSIFVGDELQAILDGLESGNMITKNAKEEFVIAVDALLNFPKDTTDRNRTSPFAFTGNKFEFRMLGSADSIACTNTILNTIVANVLCEFADKLENSTNFSEDLNKLLKETYIAHKAVIFNGNGYDDAWLKEAEKRGLPNYPSTVDALPHYTDEKNVKMFEKFGVYTKTELESRTEILLENYLKTLNIEALTMIDMAKKDILPTGMKFAKALTDAVLAKKAAGVDADVELALANKVSGLTKSISAAITELEAAETKASAISDVEQSAKSFRYEVMNVMAELRRYADELETITPSEMWPMPTYSELLFNI